MNPNSITYFPTTTTANTNYGARSNQTNFLLPSLYSPTSVLICHPNIYTFSQLPPLYQFQQNESQLFPLVCPSNYIPPQTCRVLPSVSPNPFIGSNLVNISSNHQLNVGVSRTHNSSAVLPTINLPQTVNPSSASKAARMRRKMAMRMKSSSSSRRCSSSVATRFNKRASLFNTATKIAVNNINNFSSPFEKKQKFIFEKELTYTDVGPLGSIILPEKLSVEDLPALGDDGRGIYIAVHDVDSPMMWLMRLRFCINNETKIYILENTGSYVKHHDLKIGDRVTEHKDESNLLHISCKKDEPSLNVEGSYAEQHYDMYPVAAPSLNVERPDAVQHHVPVGAGGDCNLPDFDDFPWFD